LGVQSYYETHDNIPTVLVLNKIDLVANVAVDNLKSQYSLVSGLGPESIFAVSCITKQGIDKFGSGMAKILESMTGSRENVLATSERQRRLLYECITYLQAFLGALISFYGGTKMQ